MVTTSSMATRSSLELMLDKLQQLEEQPKGIPPALPVRPVSRARSRLPRPRRPLQLDLVSFERKRRKNDEIAESDGIAASAAQLDNFLKKIQESGKSKEIAEKGICKIQKCYRGHQVRGCYKELRRGVIALQSFIRGENARRGYQYTSATLRAIITIQKQTRKYLEHQAAVARLQPHFHLQDQTRVPYTSLVDLQKQVVRTEARLREKKEENILLKRKLFEMEKKWQQYEERMKSMEKEWQDQLTYIQECLAAGKQNPGNQIRFSIGDQNPETIIAVTSSGIPNGRTVDIPDFHGSRCEEGEGGEDEVCLKLRPAEELRKLKLRFKAWKKDYKNKMRDAQSSFRKIGNTETAKSQKNWWGIRLSH